MMVCVGGNGGWCLLSFKGFSGFENRGCGYAIYEYI